MTKILNFGLKIKGAVGRVAHAKSSDPATAPKFGTCTLSQNLDWNLNLTLPIPWCFRHGVSFPLSLAFLFTFSLTLNRPIFSESDKAGGFLPPSV